MLAFVTFTGGTVRGLEPRPVIVIEINIRLESKIPKPPSFEVAVPVREWQKVNRASTIFLIF